MRRALRLLAAVGLLAAATAASAGQVKYMLWDSLQLPAYRQCAADFTRANPGTTIKIMQAGWGDYWTAISTGFISGVAPDVFTNHLGKHPEFVANELLVDLAPYIRRDGVDLSAYPRPLVQVWARDGRQYGLPKDWDTVALMVNLDHARKAGVSLDELRTMSWNPRDGGSFEQVVRRLTLDRQGRNALHPDFDRRNVAVYGYQVSSAGGMAGQVEWSHFAYSNGFRFQAEPWAVPYQYDSPRLAETLDWLASLPAKGLSAPFQNAMGVGASAMFAAGRVAMVAEGAWMITYFAGNAKFASTWVPLPVGPSGRRASMLNGLSDAMWVGSKVKEEAWQWIKYLASPACQRVVAARGVTLPAYRGLAEEVVAQHRSRGVDAQAFVTMSQADTFLMPIAENGAQVEALVKHAIESVLLGRQAAAPALAEAQRKVDRLFRRRPTPP
jgi:multiple sugar transport system substrate-binding protein